MRAFIGLFAILITGCRVHRISEPLPVDPAIRQKVSRQRPKLFLDELVEWNSLPFFIPYEKVGYTHDDFTSRNKIALDAWWRGATSKADVVRVLQTEQRPPNVQTTAIFYRLANCNPGFVADESGMVLEAGSAKASGLLEGDKILLLDGIPFELGASARSFKCYNRLWKLKPGETVKLTWIRPGAGKLEASIQCQPNPPEHLKLEDSIEWKEPPPPDEVSRRGGGRTWRTN